MKAQGRILSTGPSNRLEKLSNAIQHNCGPFNQDHPGYHNLSKAEQDRLNKITEKLQKGQPLSSREKEEFDRLKEKMRPHIPYDQLHPGFDHLTPDE